MRYVVPLLALLATTAPALAAPRTYELPEETAVLAPGPNLDLVQGNCAGCHSAEYVSTQPRGLPDPEAFWTAEVIKMRKVYGAPLQDADLDAIVHYLTVTYGP